MLCVYGDSETVRYVDDGQPLTEEECEVWLHITEVNYQKYGYGMSVIEALDTENLIGFIGIVHPGGQLQPEIKYALEKRQWGHGYASEAVAGMIDYISRVFGYKEVIATIDPENGASRRVLQKSGFVFDRVEQENGEPVEYLTCHC